MNHVLLIVPACAAFLAGCGVSGSLPGKLVGVDDTYNYSPSVIQTGDIQQFWWCTGGENPFHKGQYSDDIRYETINLVTHQRSRPAIVLAETPGTWDAAYTCNPRVIQGTFVNPLGNGQTYAYEMFYVGTSNEVGIQNAIGAAFSHDGLSWTKYPQPVIITTDNYTYGVGQPVAYNQDGKSSIVLFYEDSHTTTHHVEAVSKDGLHFIIAGTLTLNGLEQDNANPTWGDMGYDPGSGNWYAAFQVPTRDPSTTGEVLERGNVGIQLYRIPDSSLLSGTTPWTLLTNIDTNLTGYESNFLPSFLHDGFGNINFGPFPSIQLFPSISDPAPGWSASPADAGYSATVNQWVIGSYQWVPNHSLLPLTRYMNAHTYEVTTGWTDPWADFKQDAALGHLYEVPQGEAIVALYGCKTGSSDYYISLDRGCDHNRILGTEGYGYSKPVAGVQTVPLYRCSSSSLNHFISHDPQCEGQGTGVLLAYGVP